MDAMSPEAYTELLEQQLEGARLQNRELRRANNESEQRCEELQHQVALLDRLRVAAICRQALPETRRRNPCAYSRRLEIAALDRVMTDCEDELQRLRSWRAKQQGEAVGSSDQSVGKAAGTGDPSLDAETQTELTTLRSLLRRTEMEIRKLKAAAQQHESEPSHHRPEEYLSLQEQQAIVHERDRLQSELAHCQAELQELQLSATAAQRNLQATIGESDAMIHAVLERIAKVQADAEEDAANIARNAQDGTFCAAQIRQRLESMRTDIQMVDPPTGAAFGSTSVRILDPQLLKRLQRDMSLIGRSLEKLEAALEASMARARAVSCSMSGSREATPLTSPTADSFEKKQPKAEQDKRRWRELSLALCPPGDTVQAAQSANPAGHPEALAASGGIQTGPASTGARHVTEEVPQTPPRLDVGASSAPSNVATVRSNQPSDLPLLQDRQQEQALLPWSGAVPSPSPPQQVQRPRSPLSRSSTRDLFSAETEAHEDEPLMATMPDGLSDGGYSGPSSAYPEEDRNSFRFPSAQDPLGGLAGVTREVKEHLARLDALLEGGADSYSSEELGRLRASLQQMLRDADDANVDVDSLRHCLTEMMTMMCAHHSK